MPAPGSTQPPPAPAQLVVGTALSIDSGASGKPVHLRVARSANGDGFAVWVAEGDPTAKNLWANRYSAAAAAWGSPINIPAGGTKIDELDLAVDASGNATVAWHEVSTSLDFRERGVVMSARFDAGTGAWATPVPLSTNAGQLRLASDATGAVLAVYVAPSNSIHGRFFDPVSSTWQPDAAIEQNRGTRGTGSTHGPAAALLDGNGNALVAFNNERISGISHVIGSNYFARSTGDWVFQLAPDACELLGEVPSSASLNGDPALATSTDGNFLLAWGTLGLGSEIRIARFTSSTRTWSEAQTLVPGSIQKSVELMRNGFGSDATGNALLMFNEISWNGEVGVGTLKAIRVDPTGAASSAAQVIDGAVGSSGAFYADLAVDPLGHAIAIWQKGDPTLLGSRSDIGINRFDGATGTWAGAVFAETQPGNAISPDASASGGQALLGWIQAEGGVNRVKALLQPLTDTPSR